MTDITDDPRFVVTPIDGIGYSAVYDIGDHRVQLIASTDKPDGAVCAVVIAGGTDGSVATSHDHTRLDDAADDAIDLADKADRVTGVTAGIR